MPTSKLKTLGGTFAPLKQITLDPGQRVGEAVVSIPLKPNLRKWQRAAKLNGHNAREPVPDGSGRRTRLDMDFGSLLLRDGQHVIVTIKLPSTLFRFLDDGLSVTAQNPEGSDAFFNLTRVDDQTVSFACVRAATTPHHYPRFNILFVVTDEDDSTFSLPVIIDPSIRNRG